MPRRKTKITRIKISPSLLENWRVVRLGLYNAGPERLVEYITKAKDFVVSPEASRGYAYHKILEEGPSEYRKGDTYRVQDERNKNWHIFSQKAVEPIVDLRHKLQGAVAEVWGRYETHIGGYHIRCNQRYDMMLGLQLHECKTTGRKPNYFSYYDSLQWRCYLLGSGGCTEVNYHVFQLDKKNSKCQYHEFTYHPYENLETDIKYEMAGLISWLEQDGNEYLLDHLVF